MRRPNQLSLRLYDTIETVVGRRLVWRIGRWLYFGARRELQNNPRVNGEHALQDWVINACVQAGDKDAVFFDVGANVGEWSSRLAEQLAISSLRARILAFEPAPAQWSVLDQRLGQRASMLEIRCLNEALSDSPGRERLVVTGDDTGTNSLLGAGSADLVASVPVNVGTVDAAMERDSIRHITLLKIDTEGHDPNVILGARSAMARCAIDVIQFEYNWRWLNFNHSMKSLFDAIRQFDYTLGRLSPHEIELYQHWHPELDHFIETNFVLLSPRLAKHLPVSWYTFDAANVAVPLRAHATRTSDAQVPSAHRPGTRFDETVEDATSADRRT